MRCFALLSVVCLALLAVGLVAAMPPLASSAAADVAAAQAPLQFELNSECNRKCAADSTCVAACAFCGEGDDAYECQFSCREKCMHKATLCVQRCAAEAAAKPTPSAAELKAQRSAQPQPRPAHLNTGFGPEKAVNFAGYVSVNGSAPGVSRHLWYWFFESRSRPDTDPLILWMTGGPGCSGLVALFKENGPYHVADDLSLSLNPYSWNSNASIIFIDQPVGTGYSFADAGDEGPFNEVDIADNVYQFLQGFLSENPKFRSSAFYLTGESYAGHYLPSVGSRILAGNKDNTQPKINLHAIAIGNGLVNPLTQYAQYLPFITVQNKLPQSSLDDMAEGLPGCLAAIKKCDPNNSTTLSDCLAATETCNLSELMPFELSGLNVYDVREKCEVPPLCYNFSNVDAFLAQPAVIEALGVTGITWQSCNKLVDLALVFAGDWMRDLTPLIPNILAEGVRVVVYSGEYDFVCNWYGGQAWANGMQWHGQSAFNNAANTTWTVNQKEAGSARTAQGLTFVRVKDAGHMVPLNQPVAALDMLKRVINGQPFDSKPVVSLDENKYAAAAEHATKPLHPAHHEAQTIALE